MLGLATRVPPVHLVLIEFFLKVLEVTKCVLVVTRISIVFPYQQVTPNLKVHSNYSGFVIIAEELWLQYDYIIYKMISPN